MDQDFHFYGTYYAAKAGGFSSKDATLIAKAANFIDFFSETKYAAYWELVTETKWSKAYTIKARFDNPRYTYQGTLFGNLTSPEDGLWCSYHFLPGNYAHPRGAPSCQDVHGIDVAAQLPHFEIRDTDGGKKILEKYNPKMVKDLEYGRMLTRPQSALSRALIQDAKRCASEVGRLEKILKLAKGGEVSLSGNGRDDVLRRFNLILLGVRAHVIADTWAHQDHCGLNNVMNTYWDVNYVPNSWNVKNLGYGVQTIDYLSQPEMEWSNKALTSTAGNKNFEAAPGSTSYLGHGWLGHFPDFSFIKFRYKPCWSNPDSVVERDNPKNYNFAWLEISSLFHQAKNSDTLTFNDNYNGYLEKAKKSIRSAMDLNSKTSAREFSMNSWLLNFPDDKPVDVINVKNEPDNKAVLDGMVQISENVTRFGTNYVNIESDLYLFQVAADYHFHFVKNYLRSNNIYDFTGSWSKQESVLSLKIVDLFNEEELNLVS